MTTNIILRTLGQLEMSLFDKNDTESWIFDEMRLEVSLNLNLLNQI